MIDKNLDLDKLKRKPKAQEAEEDKAESSQGVSGAVGKAIDLAFNPTREKIREVTIINTIQGRLFPLLDIINEGRQYIMEIALYRENKDAYKALFNKKGTPIMPNLLDEFMYRTAQWQKSVQGTNLTKITDIALAETEVRSGEEDEFAPKSDPWKD